jgi:hypothetical protein
MHMRVGRVDEPMIEAIRDQWVIVAAIVVVVAIGLWLGLTRRR